ncbi:hypothetical protein JAAARDRAFT_193715 [Jaapia argillacea MUCL 33604]|uniref:Uncharacterized protein n=1 Tax=Jaapia argillacea MUCL 33604 TaxID=933084 RepID=A0A067PRD6_9AGAM|nr:hypothetical protein JAAARDRAFT_193715 [Jaapia argillacea MUCL 33604]
MPTYQRIPTARLDHRRLADLNSFRSVIPFAPPTLPDDSAGEFTLQLHRHVAFHTAEGQTQDCNFCDYQFHGALLQVTKPNGAPGEWHGLVGDGYVRLYINRAYNVKKEEGEEDGRGAFGEALSRIFERRRVESPIVFDEISNCIYPPTPPPSASPLPVFNDPFTFPPAPVVPVTSFLVPRGGFNPLYFVTSLDHILQPLNEEVLRHFGGETYSDPNLLATFNRCREWILCHLAFLRHMYGVSGDAYEYHIGILTLSFDLYEGVLAVATGMSNLLHKRDARLARREQLERRNEGMRWLMRRRDEPVQDA